MPDEMTECGLMYQYSRCSSANNRCNEQYHENQERIKRRPRIDAAADGTAC